MSYPEAPPASEQYAYIDPKKAPYDIARLSEQYHPLDAWKTLGKAPLKQPYYFYTAVYGMSVGILAQAAINWHAGFPYFAQIYKHITGGILFTGFAFWYGHKIRERAARRDAIIQDYLETHYDDFPLVQRRKFKDQFQLWHPVR